MRVLRLRALTSSAQHTPMFTPRIATWLDFALRIGAPADPVAARIRAYGATGSADDLRDAARAAHAMTSVPGRASGLAVSLSLELDRALAASEPDLGPRTERCRVGSSSASLLLGEGERGSDAHLPNGVSP